MTTTLGLLNIVSYRHNEKKRKKAIFILINVAIDEDLIAVPLFPHPFPKFYHTYSYVNVCLYHYNNVHIVHCRTY